ncbi:MAG: hypothetical protein LQ350_008090 [Teloschistes chrysophthalmus]|nr:MAG: hypothetical protein LQ350_008090 [Niorma chrysophthalma]
MAFLSKNRADRLHYAPLLNFAILIISVLTFGLAVSYAHAAINTPMWPQALVYMRPRPSNSKIIVYSAFMPFFTILQSILNLTLHFLYSLHPIYSLAISSVYFIGWLVQWSIWMHCEISGIGFENAGKGETCWQVNIDHRKDGTIPLRSSQGVVNGRVGLGAVVIALYAVYAVLAAMAVFRNRRGGSSMRMK